MAVKSLPDVIIGSDQSNHLKIRSSAKDVVVRKKWK